MQALGRSLCLAWLLRVCLQAAADSPSLQIQTAGSNVVLTWPALSQGMRLESRPSLAAPWTAASEEPSLTPGQFRLTTPATESAKFYRIACSQPENCGCLQSVEACVFVAPPPFGSRQNPGTSLLPLANIAEAIHLAAQAKPKKTVYVAQGTYTNVLPLELVSGVNLFGQFDGTTNWRRGVGNTTTIKGPSTAILANQLDAAAYLDGFSIEAADATQPGESSYGIRVLGGTGTLFVQFNTIVSGKGVHGMDGTNGTAGLANAPGGNGKDGRADSESGGRRPGPGGQGICGLDGGMGGWGGSESSGEDGLPGEGWNGVAGSPGSPGTGGHTSHSSGHDGLDGLAGAAGQNGTNIPPAIALGTFASATYLPAFGTSGASGTEGAGGGGGGGGGAGDASNDSGSFWADGGGGGGGGGGGCPGTPGQGGGGGGGSFALFVSGGKVHAQGNVFQTSSGGAGGNGGNGGLGGAGGLGGKGGKRLGDSGNGGHGGPGGTGGAAGSGSGGPGGPSIAVFFSAGSVLELIDNQFAVGLGGAGGAGGTNAILGAAAGGLPGVVRESCPAGGQTDLNSQIR